MSDSEGPRNGARPLVLASSSPRRQALLGELGLSFTVIAADIDERSRPGEAPDELVLRLSQGKATAVAGQRPEAVVLAADTVVALSDTILGKPAGPLDALDMLSALRGRAHNVFTAVTTIADGRLSSRLSCSHVWMRRLSDDEIRAYVATGDPLDKAGAYAIQHPTFSLVDRWDGCYSGIMGLPLGIVAELLAEAGVRPPDGVAATCERYSGRCCLRGGHTGC